MSARAIDRTDRTDLQELGLFLVLVALPLVFVPFTTAPLVDAKLVVLLGACLVLALANVEVNRTIAFLAILWVAVLALAAAVGIDPWWSLLGSESQGTGVLALGACALLLCVGTGVTHDLASRLPRWLFWTGAVVSSLTVLGRFISPGGTPLTLSDHSPLGLLRLVCEGIVGHRVFVGGFIAAAAIAALPLKRRLGEYGGLLIIGSGLAVSASRSAWVGICLGLVMAVWRQRWQWRSTVGVLVPIVFAVTAWTVAGKVLPHQSIEFSAAPRFTQLEEGSAQERLAVWKADLRAWSIDPVLGSGPSTTWHGFLAHATGSEIRTAGRNNADAHNILLELGVTTGVIGVAAFLVLGLFVAVRIRRSPADRAWAAGAAVAVGTVHLFQPLNLRLTPLLFLTAGLAAGPALRTTASGIRLRAPIAVLAAVALVLGSARFISSALESYGSNFASEAALRWSLRFEPHRVGARLDLAGQRAFDSTNDPRAKSDVRALLKRAVRQHRWNPQARLAQANLTVAIGDNLRIAQRQLEAYVRIFPNDPLGIAGLAVLEQRLGNSPLAVRYARRALAIDPQLATARMVIRSVKSNNPLRP